MKTRKKIGGLVGLALLLMLAGGAQAQPDLVYGEYFFDVDPGLGNATEIPFADGPNPVINLDIPVGDGLANDLGIGPHTLHIRFLDANGAWGLSDQRTVLVESGAEVTAAEYFFDAVDPGLGSATPLTITPGAALNETAVFVTSGLASGNHTLQVRLLDDEGNWGHTETRTLLIDGGTQPEEIEEIEYFFDTDPGFGAGTNVVFSGAATADFNGNLSLASLSPGAHVLHVRAKNKGQEWGHISSFGFFLFPPSPTAVDAVEYFFDEDPGVGAGVAVPLSAAPSLLLNPALDTATPALAPGFHTLHLRSHQNDGTWGMIESRQFYLSPPATPVEPSPLAALEFFFDVDPGVGAALPLAVPAGLQHFSVDHVLGSAAALPQGTHTLMMRLQNQAGAWGLGEQVVFQVGDNGPPILVNPIADQILLSGGGNFVVDLSALPPVFTDPDNDNISYTVSSSQPSSVLAGLIDDAITVVPQGPGASTVSIDAQDPTNPVTTATFNVTVADWAARLRVHNASENIDLVFGQASGATDGIDAGYGESELKPPAAATLLDGRFESGASNGLALDLRDEALPIWFIALQAGTQGYPVSVSWERDTFPASGVLRLVDAATEGTLLDVDMQEVGTVSIGNSAIDRLKIIFSPTISFSTTLGPGWQMVSLPLVPLDPLLGALYPDALSAFRYNGGYVEVNRLDPCEGYWVNLASGGTYTFTGTAVQLECDTALPTDWSLIGGPWMNVPVAGVVQDPGGILTSVFGLGAGYEVATAFDPGNSYWVQLSGSGSLLIADVGAPKPVAPVVEAPHEGPSLWVGGGGWEQELRLDAAEGALQELPPLPPAGTPDARFVLGGLGTWNLPQAAEERRYALSMQGPVQTLSWDFPPERARFWQVWVNGDKVDLTQAGQRPLAADDRVELERRLVALPQNFALGQNYPNPFNPSTTIRYQLPEDARVVLKLYDVAGQVVRRLVAENQAAGAYQVVWDGRDQRGKAVANGVYFYELRAGEFSQIRKMVLAK